MWIWNYSRDLTEVSGGVDAAGEPVNGRGGDDKGGPKGGPAHVQRQPSIPDEATYDRTWY